MKQECKAVTRFMGELVVCGGILYTRWGLWKEMREQGVSERLIDYQMFLLNKATSEDIAGAINEVPNEYPDEIREMLGLAKRDETVILKSEYQVV